MSETLKPEDIATVTAPRGVDPSWWKSIPEARDRPLRGEQPTRLDTRVPARRQPTRRTVLAVAGAAGAAVALNLLQAMSGIRVPFASATVGTEWTGCSSFSYSNDIVCTPGSVYSYIYCGNDGWFKHYNNGNERYRPIVICNGRNAWRWVHDGIRYRCADGEFSYYRSCCGWTSWTFKICAQWLGPA